METSLFSWVHISDLHFGQGQQSQNVDQELVLGKLKEDLIELKKITKFDAIFITGDIAYSGKEYDKASGWLADIFEVLELKASSVFMVPGNHDAQRDVLTSNRHLQRLSNSLRNGDEKIDDVISVDEEKDLLLSKFQNYIKFKSNYSPDDLKTHENIYWEYGLPFFENIKILGLNTALLCQDDDDKGKLQLGNFQIREINKTSGEDLLIVLSHHPFNWLSDEGNISKWVESKKHIHLVGHVHRQESTMVQRGSGQNYIELISGASHSPETEKFNHSYNIASIISDDRKTVLRVWPRLWSDKNKEFRVDIDNVINGEEFFEHQININLDREIKPIKSDVFRNNRVIQGPIREETSLEGYSCDSPPTLPAWVGREAEIDLLNDPEIKLFVITGIGGQGKSALASRYIEGQIGNNANCFWDWRDCREEGDTFRTHIIRIIERLTFGSISPSYFVDSNLEYIVDYMFGVLEGGRQRIFVFDNIDHYIDAENGQPVLGVEFLFKASLERRHPAKFIFTCRPNVSIDHPLFYNINLGGLSPKETQDLFIERGVKIESHSLKRAIADVHSLTGGHPLWLNLIATQVAKDKSKLSTLIEDIKRGIDAGLPKTMLLSIWKTLSAKQILVLRYMAEMVRSETEEQIANYVSSEMTWNRFSRTIRSLKDLALVIVKSAPNTKDTLDLHPLVRTFITTEFPKSERKKYIVHIATFYDSLIAKLHKIVTIGSNFQTMENWIYRAELALNAGLYEDAFKAIDDISDPLLGSGYQEEFVRFVSKLLQEIEFSNAIIEEYKNFDNIVSDFSDVLCHLGRFGESMEVIKEYEKNIPGKSARFVNLCDMKCYHYWLLQDYEQAKYWGQKGVDFVKESNVDTKFSSEHNLALSQRESGEVDEALRYFTKGNDLEEILGTTSESFNKDAVFFGNIGRCLFLKGDIEKSIKCFVKSAIILEKSTDKHSYMNKGWASNWIGDSLEKNRPARTSAIFLLSKFNSME